MKELDNVYSKLVAYVEKVDYQNTVYIICGIAFYQYIHKNFLPHQFNDSSTTCYIKLGNKTLYVSLLDMFDNVQLYNEKLTDTYYNKESGYPSIITPDRKIINYPYETV